MTDKRLEFESFTDGRISIRRPGEEQAYIELNYGEEQIGVTRYYQALSADVHIKRIIHIPQRREIEANFTAEAEGKTYVIKEAQHKDRTHPKVTVLVLGEA